MGSTLCCNLLHIIYSTKDREPLILPEFAPRLYAYIGGIAKHRDSALIASGGIEDHVHLLVNLHQSHALADFVRDLKSNSSRWMHEDIGMSRFGWQTGYAAFSVSKSNVESVKHYIDRQREHHAGKSFEEELIEFLQKHEVDYDPRYIFA